MLKNHWNTLKFRLFGQSTEQTLSNFELWRSCNTSNFEGWSLTLVAYKKSVLVILVKHNREEEIEKNSL